MRVQGANISLCVDISVALTSNSLSDFNVHKLSRRLAVQSLGTLTADAELFNQSQVFVAALFGNVLKQALALAYQLQQPAAGHEVVLVLLHVLGQLGNPGSHNSHLHCRRTTILIVGHEVFGNLGLLLLSNHSGVNCSKSGVIWQILLGLSYLAENNREKLSIYNA